MRQINHCAIIEPLETRRLLAAVAVDLNFGVEGRVVSDFGGSEGVSDAILQADGKVLVLGSSSNPFLVRYKPDGTRDESFAPRGQLALPKPGNNTDYSLLHVLPDGKMLVSGTVFFANATRFLFVRLNPDLSLDASFGSGGIVTSDFLYLYSSTYSFASLPDGKVLAAGQTSAAGNQAGIWRFNSDGTLDQTFGANGGGFIQYLYEGANNPSISSLLLNPDGSFFGVTPLGEAKFAANGVRDTSFGNQGYLPQGVTLKRVLSDGKMLGFQRLQVGPTTADIVVSRWNTDGTSDASFGNNGVRQIDFAENDLPYNLKLDAAGRIILGAATLNPSTGISHRFALARLLPHGQLDSSFGTGGRYIDEFGTRPDVLLPTPDNKILTAGYGSERSTEDPTLPGQGSNVVITRYAPDILIDLSIQASDHINEGDNFVINTNGSSYDNGQIVRDEWNSNYDGWKFNRDAEGVFTVLRSGDNPAIPVALRVTTSDGLRAQASFLIPTINVPPVANAGPDRSLLAGAATQLPMRSDDAVKETGSLRVDYGDGTAQGVFNFTTPTNPFTATPSHTYTKSGTYTLTLTADDGDGGISTDTATIRVFNIIANVFQDLDAQGTKSSNEPVFPDRTVWVDLNDNGMADPNEPTSVTDANGDAFFSGLAAGTYKLRVQLPTGWQPSFVDANFRGDYVAATITATAGVKVSVGLTQKSGVTGTVFNDANGNGVRDAGEAGISGRGIDTFLASTGGAVLGAFSGTDGYFHIRNLSATEYRLNVPALSGQVATLPAAKGSYVVSLGLGQTITNIDFGLRTVAGATANGFVFEDIDGDGANGPADRPYYPNNPVGASSIYIDINNNGVRELNEPLSGISSTNSTWTMSQLAAGTYTFRLAPRAGWVQTFPANNAGFTVTLAAGETIGNLDFGLQKTDLVQPQVTSFTFNRDVKPNRIDVFFSEPVQGIFNALVLQPVGGATIALDFVSNTPPNTASYFSRTIAVLPDGNYRAAFKATAPIDLAGNSLSGQTEWFFFALKGDLNGDRSVSVTDFITLASNFNKTNATYSDGDINYDGTVTIADFIDLAANFGASLAPPAAAIVPQAPASESVSLTSPSEDLLQSADSRVTKGRRPLPDWRKSHRLHHRRQTVR